MTFTLDRLPFGEYTPQQFQIWWQRMAEQIEGAVTSLQIAQETASARMPAVPAITFPADSSGAVASSQFPRNVQFRRYSLDTDVTTDAVWTATLLSGASTFAIGAATGVLQFTALSADSVIEVKSVRGGVSLTTIFNAYKSSAASAPPSGGGTMASDNALGTTASATHAAVSQVLTVTVGSAGIVTLTAPDIDVSTAGAVPAGIFPIYGKWQWDSTGAGVWVDVATEVVNSSSTRVQAVGGGSYEMTNGALTVNASKTGLTAASSQKFRLMGRNSSGTRTMYLYGAATATGS